MVQVIAPYILGEVVTREDWYATGIIIFGATLSTSFGSHCSVDYTLDEMLALFESRPLHYAECFWVVSVTLSYYFILIKIPSLYPNTTTDEVDEYNARKYTSICFAYLAGAFAANQNIAFKAIGEILEQTFDGKDEWYRWECYVLLGLVVLFSYLQLTTMNKGLSMWKAVKNLPIYNVFYAIMSTTYGGVFYKEYENLSTVGVIMFPIGVCFTIGGISMLALVAPDDSDPSIKGYACSAKVVPIGGPPHVGPMGGEGDGSGVPDPPTMDTGGAPTMGDGRDRREDYACSTSSGNGSGEVGVSGEGEERERGEAGVTPGEPSCITTAGETDSAPTVDTTAGGDGGGERSPVQLAPMERTHSGKLPPISLPGGKGGAGTAKALPGARGGATPQ